MQSIFQTIAEANRQIDVAQSVVSNNLANVGTTAFKADLYAAQVQYRGMSRTSSHNQALVENFFKQIQDTDIKVFQFTMDPEPVRALFDYDPCEFEDTCMVKTLSEYVDIFNTVSEDKKVEFLCSENSNWYRSNDEDLYTCYQ